MAKTLDTAPVEQFVSRGVSITVDKSLKFDMRTLKLANVQATDIVLFQSGMSERYHAPIYFEDYQEIPKQWQSIS